MGALLGADAGGDVMIKPIQKHELEFINNSDGLVKCCKGDRVLLARFNEMCELSLIHI